MIEKALEKDCTAAERNDAAEATRRRRQSRERDYFTVSPTLEEYSKRFY